LRTGQQAVDLATMPGVVAEVVGAGLAGADDGASVAAGESEVVSVGDGEDVSVDVEVSVGDALGLALGAGGGAEDVVCPGFGEDGLHDSGVVGWDPVPRADSVPLVCEAPGLGAPEWPPEFGVPGCELELLGKIAVDASIAT
jgi:hypothetical protein